MVVGAVRFSSRSRALTALLPPVLDCSPILSSFQVILLEHIIMCRLVTGHKATALQEVRPPGPHARGGRVSGVTVCSSGRPSVSFHCTLAVWDPAWAQLIKQSNTDIRGPFPNRSHAQGIWGLGTGGPLMAISSLPHDTPAAHLPERAQGLEQGKGADG